MENNGEQEMKKVVQLRMLALVTTLIAFILTSVSNETQLILVTVQPNLPPFDVPATAKWQYISAFIYLLIANVVACAYAVSSLVLTMLKLAGMDVTILALDLVVAVLLFSGNGAAAAIGVVGYKGNGHLRWEKVCNVFMKFCRFNTASIAVSIIGALIFLMLAVFRALLLHKRTL
ncbi:CASP-like protein 1E1 [Macadamia integrifolia]|uniref:CASP-like protein 1E1 n=1 Tax=Macadamia integrifolia TaxID=60698 RepID=UPI001C52977B|nr:CASP-like protein 1E1 [Macadamia integrifolia]